MFDPRCKLFFGFGPLFLSHCSSLFEVKTIFVIVMILFLLSINNFNSQQNYQVVNSTITMDS